MGYPWYHAASFDDLLRDVYEDVLQNGREIKPARGPALERVGVLLELTNPRARLSRSETRGRLFSCLGELCWYLAASDQAAFIRYYVAKYPGSDATGTMPGAYGPRIFGGPNPQFRRIREILASKRDSRQAVIQIFDKRDLETGQEDVPCTCTLQFLARQDSLELVVHMRSNDVFLGLAHDIFCFTMFQEIMARDLSLELGTYKHFVGSLHLYQRDRQQLLEFLDEGWHSSQPMPSMPERPWSFIPDVLATERRIRAGELIDPDVLARFGPYWADIVRLLMVFSQTKRRDKQAASATAAAIESDVYTIFVNARVGNA